MVAGLLFTLTRRELRELSNNYEKHLRAEEEKSRQLAESRERFQITLNSLGDAVIATDADGTVRYINPVAQQLTGWTDYLQAQGRPLREVARLLDERTREPFDRPGRSRAPLRKSHRRCPTRRLLVSRSGQEYPIEMNAAPIIEERRTLRRGAGLPRCNAAPTDRTDPARQRSPYPGWPHGGHHRPRNPQPSRYCFQSAFPVAPAIPIPTRRPSSISTWLEKNWRASPRSPASS